MNYPQEMAALKQWLCWRLEPDPKGGKPRKVPYDPKTGRKASSTDPATWATLIEAQEAQQQYLYTGVGFVFTKDGGIVGVDIDHCLEDGLLNQFAKEIMIRYPTYTEVSPSGTGLHLFYTGSLDQKGNKNSETGVEMYAHSRFFTMTGNRMEDMPDAVADGVEALPWIHATYVAKKKAAKKRGTKQSVRAVLLTDEQVLEKIHASQSAEDFHVLWEGQWAEKYGSQSEADLSLCCTLAFWTGKNKEQMDRLFRQSKLMRGKWDSVHHASGATYGEETLVQAIERTDNTYSPGGDLGIYEESGRYIRVKGENTYALTNFLMKPVEMLVADEETQMTCDLVTMYGETFRQTFMTTDFGNLQKFKGVLNKRTISLSYTGSEGDLEVLKSYLAGLEWQIKYGVKALGLHIHDGHWAFVTKNKAFMAGNAPVEDVVQLEKYVSIDTDLMAREPISAVHFSDLAQPLLSYNEPAKTITVLGWCCGCFVKEILRASGIKYPHLFLIGEAGSGKSTTLERIILPLFGRSKVVAAPQVTAFTLMKDAASSNLIPQALDEFKPSKIDKMRISALYNHFRDSYDGHEGVRGRSDQTQVSYGLLAPLVVAGEESPDEPAIRERGMELLFSKRDLKDIAARMAFSKICDQREMLTSLGRALLDSALTLSTKAVKQWHNEALAMFNAALPSRVLNNLACCMVGIRVLEVLCIRLGFTWSQVFSINMDACVKHMEYAVREYLLDGGESNKSVVEQTLEVMDRMGLSDEECRIMEDGKIAFHFRSIYDRYTQYRRDHAILGECLPYTQFMKQLRKSDLYVESKAIRIHDDVRKAVILNYDLLRKRCEIEGFLQSQAEPLVCSSLLPVTM